MVTANAECKAPLLTPKSPLVKILPCYPQRAIDTTPKCRIEAQRAMPHSNEAITLCQARIVSTPVGQAVGEAGSCPSSIPTCHIHTYIPIYQALAFCLTIPSLWRKIVLFYQNVINLNVSDFGTRTFESLLFTQKCV